MTAEIEFINKEEELFQWEVSNYCEIDQIATLLEPYQKLFTTVLKWQRTEKKWMDGSFVELDPEEVEVSFSSRRC